MLKKKEERSSKNSSQKSNPSQPAKIRRSLGKTLDKPAAKPEVTTRRKSHAGKPNQKQVQRSLFKSPLDSAQNSNTCHVTNQDLASEYFTSKTSQVRNLAPNSNIDKYFNQSPEDSMNISIQNEKFVNEKLEQIELEEADEFEKMEKLISEDSKLNLTEIVTELIQNSNPSSKSSSRVLNGRAN